MRVSLIGPYSLDFSESINRFSSCLLAELRARGCNANLLTPKPRFGRLIPHAGCRKWLGYLDKFVLFPLELKRVRLDGVVHLCDQGLAPYVPLVKNKPHLVTCNDLLAIRSARGEFPENPTRWSGRVYQRRILAGLQSAKRVTCISSSTRRDLLRLAELDPCKVDITPMGMRFDFRPVSSAKSDVIRILQRRSLFQPHLAANSFILHVGGTQWYKNRIGALKIFASLPADTISHTFLLLVGKPLTAQERDFIHARQLASAVISLSGCTDEDLRSIYSEARVLLFPSLYEGFGWPIIEAQACGCPVITSNKPPMTETGGPAALYIDPTRHESAACSLAELLAESQAAREARRQAGIRNAARFSTEEMLTKYIRIYSELCGLAPASLCPDLVR